MAHKKILPKSKSKKADTLQGKLAQTTASAETGLREEAKKTFWQWKTELAKEPLEKRKTCEKSFFDLECLWLQFIEATSNSNSTKS